MAYSLLPLANTFYDPTKSGGSNWPPRDRCQTVPSNGTVKRYSVSCQSTIIKDTPAKPPLAQVLGMSRTNAFWAVLNMGERKIQSYS